MTISYTVERVKDDERVQIAKCDDFAEAARVVDLDKEMRGCDGSVYEVRRVIEDESET